MKTTKWGPPGWTFLHTIVHNYPENPSPLDKCNYKLFFTQCEHVLPCKYCRISFNQYIKEIPIDDYLESRESVSYWLYMIHNKVNDKLRKQNYKVGPDPDFMTVCKHYETFRAGCGKTPGKGPSCRIPVKAKQRIKNIERYKHISQSDLLKKDCR